jgi:hypothetical protein
LVPHISSPETSLALTNQSIIFFRQIEVDLNEILSQSTINTIENKSIFYRLYEILQQYDMSFTNMLNFDRYNDACDIILTRSIPIWKRFACDTTNENEQKKYLSRALRLLEQLTEILAERWHLIRTITSPNDVRKKLRFYFNKL